MGKIEMSKAAPLTSRLRRRYTRVVKMGDKWNTYLQIDHQGFCVAEQRSRDSARWYSKMLAIALERMLGEYTRELEAQHREMRSLLMRIHSARVGMSEKGVIEALNDVDNFFREPNSN